MNAITPGLRRALGYFILSMLGIYVILSLTLMAFPGAVIVSRKLTLYYRWLAMPGPFFKEERIQTSGHFYVSYKKADSTWSTLRNPEREKFQLYCNSTFDYNSLQQSRASQHLAKALSHAFRRKSSSVLHSRALRQFQAYLKPEYVPVDADSVRLVYFRAVRSGEFTRQEMIFALTYKSF